MQAKFVNEKFTEDSDPIKDLEIGLIHHYFNINKTSDNIYYFIEKGPNFVEKNKPTTYIYSVKKGNVYRKHPDLYAHQELRSNSYAFNKGNSNKMAIPDNLNAAKEFIISHYLKKLKKSLNEKFTQDSDPIADMNIGMMHQIKLWMKSIDQPFKDKDNALAYCAGYGKLDFVEYLLAAGTDVHANNDDVLQCAIVYGHIEVVKVLLAAGANVHTNNDRALRWVSEHGNTEEVKVLLAAGANVHADNDYALKWASVYGHTEVVKVLLAAGANVHAENDRALQWASNNGHTEIVKVLLAAGADVHADNDFALRWASENGNTETVKVLKDHIAKEKRKKVKESLNEKFTEDSDPITDMGIGFYHVKTFNSYKKAYDYIIEHLHLILKEESIPKDIIYDKQWFIKPKYHDKINDYVRKYIKIKGVDNILSFSHHSHLHEILKKKGYPTYEY